MKKLLLLLFIINCSLLMNNSFAQAPNAIPYQGVARNAAGNILAAQPISLRISIHDVTASGTVVFSETHAVTTNTLGLFNVNIGSGTALTGTLTGVDWGNGAKFIQVEMDPAGGVSYADMGTTQLNSVPYALYAETANVPGVPGPQGPQGPQGVQGPEGPQGPQGATGFLNNGSTAGNTPYWNGSSWITNSSNIFNNNANVGIGTTTPGSKLDVAGAIKASTTITAAGLNTAGIVTNTSAGLLGTTATVPVANGGTGASTLTGYIKGNGTSAFTASATIPVSALTGVLPVANGGTGSSTQNFVDLTTVQTVAGKKTWSADAIFNGKVGVGITNPQAKLDVAGTVSITDGSQANGYVLTSDANGLASWKKSTDLRSLISSSNSISCVSNTATFATNLNRDMVISGNNLYVLSYSSLLIYNISNPASVSLTSTTSIGDVGFQIAVSGNYAYITQPIDDKLVIYNISNPASPTLVNTGGTSIPADPQAVAVSGNYAVASAFNSGLLYVYDISAPANPVLLNGGTTNIGSSASAIRIVGNYAYVLTDRILIYDISVPSTPTLINPAATAIGVSPSNMAVSGNYLYVTDNGDNKLRIYDISNPVLPVLKNVGGTAVGNGGIDIAISGIYAYVANNTTNDFSIIDISDPTIPVIKTTGNTATGNQLLCIAAAGNYVYTGTYGGTQVKVFNVACASAASTSIAFDPGTGTISPQPVTWTTSANNISNSNSGNVGIGTSNPQAYLHVNNGNAAVNTVFYLTNTNAGFTNGGQITLKNFSAADRALQFWNQNSSATASTRAYSFLNNSGTEVFSIVHGGNVGIGISNPGYPLDVNTSATSGSTSGYLYGSSGSAPYTGAHSASIRAAGTIIAGNYMAVSDKRTKKILSISDSKKDLLLLNKIQVTDYTYIDKVINGDWVHKKVIAQQVEEVLPEAVNRSAGFVPDIYLLASKVEWKDGKLRISLSKPHGLKLGDKIKWIDNKGTEQQSTVESIVSKTEFEIPFDGKTDKAFIYGKEVKDFLTVDYEAISMLNVSATQELYKMIIELQSENEKLKNDNNAFRTDIDKIKAQLGMITEAKP